MPYDIIRKTCPFCKKKNTSDATYDSTRGYYICLNCGYKETYEIASEEELNQMRDYCGWKPNH